MEGLIQIGGSRSRGYEEERRAHLRHEAALRSAALCHGLAAVLLVLSVMGALFDGADRIDPLVAASTVLLAGALGYGARALHRLEPRARAITIIECLLAVAAFVWVGYRAYVDRPGAAALVVSLGGILFHVYLLWLVTSRRGQRVLSGPYRAVLEGSRSIRSGFSPSIAVIVGLCCLLVLVL